MRQFYTTNVKINMVHIHSKTTGIMKTKIYNLIVLDESGSMSGVRTQTITGCNETIEAIRASQREFGEKQENFVSIYAFQSDGSKPSRYIIKNMPVDAVAPITQEQYEPWGCTPLYDAVGSTLADLKALAGNDLNSVGSVTIITDGMENSSRHYTIEQVTKMIDALKEKGWNFNFIGANIDAHSVSVSFHIENHLQFQQTTEGTKDMFKKEASARQRYSRRMNDELCCIDPNATEEEIYKARREAQKDFYNED